MYTQKILNISTIVNESNLGYPVYVTIGIDFSNLSDKYDYLCKIIPDNERETHLFLPPDKLLPDQPEHA